MPDDSGADETWVVRRGCTWWDEFTATVTETGAPINITAYAITAEVTAEPASGTALKTFTVTKPDAAAGRFRIEIDESAADLEPGTYWWAMQWNDGANDVPLASGRFVVQPWTI